VINILFGNLFVGLLAARAALQQASPTIEEAAESLGAGLLRRLYTVVLPAIWPAFLLGVLYIFVDGMTTFSSVIFLVSGRWALASVEIFNQAGGTDHGAAAAKTVVILLIVALLLAIMRRL
jgi:iron(III) transport system permease protein